MRLIDADILMEFIDPEHLRHPGELVFSEVDVVNMLNHAPTAFDAEKVIEELENLREVELHIPDMCDELGNGDGESQYNDGRSQGRYEAFIEAIEIVKRGGRDEE